MPNLSLRRSFAAAALLAAFAGCSGSPRSEDPKPTPPSPLATFRAPAVRSEQVVDDYHGEPIPDPYRWLEDQDGDEVAEFVAAQNAATRAVLDAIPQRGPIEERLRELWNYARREPPVRRGGRWFWRQNDGLQNQDVLCCGDDPRGEGEVLLDPNAMSQDGTLAVSALSISHDGARIAYAVSKSGSDWRTWRVLDVATKTTLADEAPWSKFAQAAWTKDGRGFFYQRYPQPKDGETFQAQNLQPQLCYHVVGADAAQDRVVYERPDEPKLGFGPRVTHDGRLLVIGISQGTDRRNRIALVDLQEEGWPVRMLIAEANARYQFVGNDGDTLWFHTDLDAPHGRIVAIDRKDPAQLREVIQEQTATLQDAVKHGGGFLCSYLEDASSTLRAFSTDGADLGEIALPSLGTVAQLECEPDATDVYCTFSSFLSPPAVHRIATDAKTAEPLLASSFRGDASRYVQKRVFLQSKDGTRVCMFLTHRRGIRLDGKAPCLLYGYGGFGISVTPTFRVPNFVFCERGGIYAQAVLRGGGEYGEAWHKDGMLGNKQNVFDDLFACADFLVRNRYTDTKHLAIQGGSNGGLLVGACLAQRPELFGAAIPEVGVLDMLRYHRFTIGWAWAPEYGTSDDAEQFAWLRRYSPLHNLECGRAYPPTLVMTGDHDDRVLPGHSYKFAAALQAAQGGEAPILLRVDTSTGHGAGKPVKKRIEEAADRLAFLSATIGS